jgi:hypothetical protein
MKTKKKKINLKKKVEDLPKQKQLHFYKLVLKEKYSKKSILVNLLKFPGFKVLTSFTDKPFDLDLVETETKDISGLVQQRQLLEVTISESKDITFEISLAEFVEMINKSKLTLQVGTGPKRASTIKVKKVNLEEKPCSVSLSLNPIINHMLHPIVKIINSACHDLEMFHILSEHDFDLQVNESLKNVEELLGDYNTLFIDQKFSFDSFQGNRYYSF